ncbi:hypothetical protein Y032_0002g501 [Ancylostoma ceylanicum]|uniref:Uncharacterized protein n=1 Tax=Ancylostoma ceylanicum TaxID=53326 RepID=A0A016VZ78_9BILA|nr:hypothetical protein Y032_0002g501 [Ancylostoma ceylanicum]
MPGDDQPRRETHKGRLLGTHVRYFETGLSPPSLSMVPKREPSPMTKRKGWVWKAVPDQNKRQKPMCKIHCRSDLIRAQNEAVPKTAWIRKSSLRFRGAQLA